MFNLKEFYVLGLPIDTDIGEINFIKVKDYPDHIMDLQNIGMSKQEIIYKYSEMNEDGKLDELIDELESLSLYGISIGLENFRQSYFNVLHKMFGDEEALHKINEESFNIYRKLILDMNCINEEKINPNPEIQKAIERSRRVKSMDQDKLTFSDICSSIVAYSGNDYNDLLNWTVYQLYMTFHRIGLFKNYDTSTLFATVSEKATVENWSKHIDLFEEESHVMEESKFKNTTGEMFTE